MTTMQELWRLIWDILAAIGAVYVGYKTFIFSGTHIPWFGYFPIGIILAMLFAPIGLYAVVIIEAIFGYILRFFGINVAGSLPFDQ